MDIGGFCWFTDSVQTLLISYCFRLPGLLYNPLLVFPSRLPSVIKHVPVTLIGTWSWLDVSNHQELNLKNDLFIVLIHEESKLSISAHHSVLDI